LLKVNDQIALHRGLSGFKALYDEGQLGIVQGVGYPNPNRSHFRSTEIWQTASDSEKFERYGWLGRYFDNTCAGCDPTVAVTLGRQMPQAFAAKNPKGICFDNPANYRFQKADRPGPGEMDTTEESFRRLNEPDEMMDNSGGTIGALPGAAAPGGSPLDFIERTALDAQIQGSGNCQPGGEQGHLPRFATRQFLEDGRQADWRWFVHARVLCLAGRLRHSYEPARHTRTVADGPRQRGEGFRG
jgi:hypothetical protein